MNWVKIHRLETSLRYHRIKYRWRNSRLQKWKIEGNWAREHHRAREIDIARLEIIKWKKLALTEAKVCAKLEVELIASKPKDRYRFVGPASTFGPPEEAAGGTAYGLSSADAGIAINPGGGANWDSRFVRSFAMKTAKVTIGNHTAYLKVIDKGPDAIGRHGWRIVDITGAGAWAMGIDPRHFPTDAIATVEFF